MDEDELKEELTLYKERLEDAMEGGNLAWWEMELPSGKISFNERKTEMLGYESSKFEHYSDFTELLHPDDYEDTMQAMRDHLEGRKERYETEYRVKKNDGDYKWFRDVGSITEKDGEYKKVTGVVIDIDERKKAEEREELLNSLLRHDIKNKTQIVQGYLQLLEEKDLPDDVEELIVKALESSKESSNLIKKIRLLLSAQKEVTNPVDIISTIEESVEASNNLIIDKDMEISVNCHCKECRVEGGSLLKEVFTNLIENSVFHSNGNNISIKSKIKEDQVICIIEDDGEGITESEKERIFERGYTTDDERGTGLGLFLVKMLIEIYGGSIEVKDSELGGARFDVYLNRI